MEFFIMRMIFIKKQFEKDLVLFIVNELVLPSFVETPFFRRYLFFLNS
jgi:hypothetical protein